MSIPESPRVEYRRNPLANVVCQLRYPSILRINAVDPIEFQEEIRHRYPLYQAVNMTIEAPIPSPVLGQTIGIGAVNTLERSYKFASEDNRWTITLTKDYLAIETNYYENWNDFKDYLDLPLAVLENIYRPMFFSRIGLRYIDLIERSRLGLSDVPWQQLFQSFIAAPFYSTDIEGDEIAQFRSHLGLRLDNGTKVNIVHGLVLQPGRNEVGFVIDSDFFTDERKEIGDAIKTLDGFNRKAGDLFRWCITDRLADALGS